MEGDNVEIYPPIDRKLPKYSIKFASSSNCRSSALYLALNSAIVAKKNMNIFLDLKSILIERRLYISCTFQIFIEKLPVEEEYSLQCLTVSL